MRGVISKFYVEPDFIGFKKKSGYKVRVNLMRTVADIKKAWGERPGDVYAFTRETLTEMPNGIVAEIFLPKNKRLGIQVVAHEACHAALYFLYATNKRRNGFNEEHIATAVGNICYTIFKRLYARGVWK